MEPQTATSLIQILQESGPTLGGLVVAVFWLNGRVQRIEDRVEARLNNGIRDELTKIKTDIAGIQGQMQNIPKRKTDEST